MKLPTSSKTKGVKASCWVICSDGVRFRPCRLASFRLQCFTTQSRRRRSSGTQPAPSSTAAPFRPGLRCRTPSRIIMVRNCSGPSCRTATSLVRRFSPPPSQSLVGARPLFIQALASCRGAPPTCRTKGTPASASFAQKGSKSMCPGERSRGARCGTHTAFRLLASTKSSSFRASSGSSSGMAATPISRSSAAQKSIMCRLCARVAP